MDKETLQKYYDELYNYYNQYKQSELTYTLDSCKDYIYGNKELYDYVLKKISAPNPDYYYSELFTYRYFLKDMKKILLAIKSDIDKME